MTWLDALLDRGREAKVAAPAQKPSTPARAKQAEPEIISWYIQTAAPRPPDYAGAIESLFYFVDDGAVTLCDETGKAFHGKTMQRGAGDDPRRIAATLKRNDAVPQRFQPSDFAMARQALLEKGAPAATWRDDGG